MKKSNNLGWLTLVSSEGVCLCEFNMYSSRVRHYVISVLVPSLIRRCVPFYTHWSDVALNSYPYHYGFAGDTFDSIHVSREFSKMRILESYKGLQYIEPQYVLQ